MGRMTVLVELALVPRDANVNLPVFAHERAQHAVLTRVAPVSPQLVHTQVLDLSHQP